jgi:hypothetical protein
MTWRNEFPARHQARLAISIPISPRKSFGSPRYSVMPQRLRHSVMLVRLTDLQFWSVFSEVTNRLVWFGIPAFVFFRRPRSGERNLEVRLIVGVVGTWFGLLLHREYIGWPVAMDRAEGYDGVGMNAALLVLGWIFGLISSTVALVTFLTLRYVRQRTKAHRIRRTERHRAGRPARQAGRPSYPPPFFT